MEDLEDATPLRGRDGALRSSLLEDSYLFFRQLLAPDAVEAVRRAVTAELADLGWLDADADPSVARRGPGATGEGPQPTPAYFEAYERIQRLQAFHELAHEAAVVDVAREVLGDEVLVHPRKIFRVSPADDPQYVTPPHQDYRLIQGTADVLTAWIPLGACPDELGGLKVLAGSHRGGLLPALPVPATGGVGCDIASDDPRWRSTAFEAGDVLFFHSLTVHAAKPNVTDLLRLSADFRYQPRRDPVVDLSLGPHWWPAIPAYDQLTVGWTSTASVDAPEGLRVESMRNPMDDALVVPPSRFTPAG